jgi:hypothetical protein
VARVPWELAFVDGRFLATDHITPILRRPSHIRTVSRLALLRHGKKGDDYQPVQFIRSKHDAGIVIGSLQRIFPNLSPEERENLKESLPEELNGLIEGAEIS